MLLSVVIVPYPAVKSASRNDPDCVGWGIVKLFSLTSARSVVFVYIHSLSDACVFPETTFSGKSAANCMWQIFNPVK